MGQGNCVYLDLPIGAHGETGRRKGLKIPRSLRSCRFDSGWAHHLLLGLARLFQHSLNGGPCLLEHMRLRALVGVNPVSLESAEIKLLALHEKGY